MRPLLLIICVLFSTYCLAQQVDTFFNYPAYSHFRDLQWTTTLQAGGLSCLVEKSDSTSSKNLFVVYKRPDSLLMIHLRMDTGRQYKYAFFKLYPGEKQLFLVEDSILLASQIIVDTGKGNPLPVAIVSHRKDKRAEMDHLYASGTFAEPTLYSFETYGENYYDIGSFLRGKILRLQGGYSGADTPHDVMGHPVLFYLNEQNLTWPFLCNYNFKMIAYVKCWESDFVAGDYEKRMNGMSLGFTMKRPITKPKDPSSLQIPENPTPLIIAIYTYDYPGSKPKFKEKKKHSSLTRPL